jgi:hypothetical protein
MLTGHRDIQKWVSARNGLPAIAPVRDDLGAVRAKLSLNFGRRAPDETGLSPCSWSAWLAELDRQHLALKVSSHTPTDFELVDRRELN